MTRYKNQRELDEMNEDEFQEADKELEKKTEPKDKAVDWEGRYSNLRSHSTKKEQELQNQLAETRRQIEGFKNGTLKPPKTREEIEDWKTQYPDFGGVLESWIENTVEEKTKNLKDETLKIKRERALLDLVKTVPDAESLLQDQDFHNWLAEQSDLEKQKIYNSFDTKSATAILKRYKTESGKTEVEKEEDFDPRDAARSVKTRSTTNVNSNSDGFEFSESQIEEMSRRDPNWWDKNEDKILDAQRRNKVLLDITGASRGRR